MTVTRLRIGLAATWLFLGLAVLSRDALLPADWFANLDPTRLTLAGWLALLLAAWNGVRSWHAIAVRRNRFANPLRSELRER
jgi:hypothetical protein